MRLTKTPDTHAGPQGRSIARHGRAPGRLGYVVVLVPLLAGTLTLTPHQAAARPATGAPTALAPGMVTLYATRGDTTTVRVTYPACRSPVTKPLPEATYNEFSHQPLSGCQALLVNKEGRQFRLCAGHGNLPLAFQQSRRLLIQSGSTPRCQ